MMPATNRNIPYAKPSIGIEEQQAVQRVLESGWLTTGQLCSDFEKQFAKLVGVGNALAVNSATSGLHLALEAIGIRPGDKVITTPFTFTATAEVIRYLGADPVFVDIDDSDFNLCPAKVNQVLSAMPEQERIKVRAIMPVHFAGQAADMDAFRKIAKTYDLFIVEDAAHALPASYANEWVGSMGDIAVFSFYANKTMTTGEGGMVVTHNSQLAARMKTMRLHGIDRDAFDRFKSVQASWYYEVVAPGYKYNMTDIAAAIGIEQLKKVFDFQKRRETIAERYSESLSHSPVTTPVLVRSQDTHAWHIYLLRLNLESLSISRDEFIQRAAELGVHLSVHYIPLYKQPYWRDKYDLNSQDFPVSEDIYNQCVSLPIYPMMTDEDVEYVVEVVKKLLDTNLK